ncbi:YfbK domain-containing protein [Sphingobacterium bovistauri]|uniref:von Willebrand factor type A domain-containing protein n=1 Tax=Sphingobacterium bovistauri TaxID=2781959 RepID=A0ABS7Z606_9SPHI|nr:von Willebrand factor type A domain-containing protein [Sphingobacterium bovistauri]MCA5005626.1 von Willebrand factor type A domain-containing protein [Sphingobacterium bovistauri]
MKRLLILCFVLFAIVANGQNLIEIKGAVSDKATKGVIAGVSVQSSKNQQVLTDQNGMFKITSFLGDTLVFNYLGYNTERIVLKNVKDIKVFLEQSTNNLIEEVTVTAYAPQKKQVVLGSPTVRIRGVASTANYSNAATYLRGQNIVNTESYKGFEENKFISPLKEALSTFAADVDVASYNNVKRFLNSGNLPPVDAVRVEEMINYFQYDMPAPKGADPVAIKTELAISPWKSKHQLLRISLKAKDIPKDNLPASNFVFLIDVSGSMYDANKLPLVKSSLKLLVDQLRDKDKVAIVTYAGNAQVRLESTAGDQKMKIKEIIDGLEAGGSTAGGDGLKMAYNLARQNFLSKGNNRIVMATDGDFNVGASSDSDMEKLIERERESGINISVLGFGMGNYKDSKLELLANKGRGNYAYINDISEARKAMISEFGGTMFTVAKDVKIQVEFNPKYVQYYRLVGYENRLMEAEDFNNDKKVGGDMGVGHVVTAIYDIIPVGVKSEEIENVDPLKYQENKSKNISNSSTELATVKFRYKDPNEDKSKLQEQIVQNRDLGSMSEDFQFASAVAELGMLLRNSSFKQQANFDALINRAKQSKGKDDEGYRAEFVKIAENAKALMKSNDLVRK